MESYTRENTICIDVTPNPTDKEMMEFLPSDEYYKV
jgi:hypothetical protein